MNIGIMVFDDGVGGADAVVKKYLEHINYEDIVLITCEGNKQYFSDLNRFKVICIGSLSDTSFFSRIVNSIKYRCGLRGKREIEKKMIAKMRRYAKKINKIVCDEKIDVLHAHLMQAILCLSLVSEPVKKIATIHDSHGLDGVGFDLFSLEVTKKMFSRIDYVTSAVNYFFDLFEKNGVPLKQKALIPNGVNPKDYLSNSGVDYDAHKFNIVFLGGDLVVKGSDYLAEAADILKNKYHDESICIHVLRDVSDKSDFYKYIHDHDLMNMFDLIGYVSGGKHIDYMKSADLFVLPSRTEGAANTLLEAIGLNLCVVASNVGGTPEIMHNGENGILCDCSGESLAEKIHLIMGDENLRKRISKLNKEYATEFSWNSIAEQYLDMYMNSK